MLPLALIAVAAGAGYAAAHGRAIQAPGLGVPPPPPTFMTTPSNPTASTSARFAYTDAELGVVYRCTLDGGTPARCGNSSYYRGLAAGSHTFCVSAVDRFGQASIPACFHWTIAGQTFSFTIAGGADSQLSPGATVPVDLSFTNPTTSQITVTGATVTIAGTSSGSCPVSGNFSVTQQFTGSIVVQPGSTGSLSTAGVPQSQWPQLAMADAATDQDACKAVTLDLSYAGTATSP